MHTESKSVMANISNLTCDEKEEVSKEKTKDEKYIEDLTQEELEKIDEHLAFLSRRFSKLKLKRNPSMFRPPTSFVEMIINQAKDLLIDQSLNASIVELLTISLMSAENLKVRRRVETQMALTTRKSIMTFSDRREKLFVFRRERLVQHEGDDSNEEEFINTYFHGRFR